MAFCLQLATLVLPLPTIPGDHEIRDLGSALTQRPDGHTTSVVVSQVGNDLYWSVNASVNGQSVTLMLDTGSSDL